MTPERIAELRPFRVATASDGDACIVVRSLPSPNEIRSEYTEMLDEIERLQEAHRWRDPAVELPEDNRPVIVALRRIEGLWPPIPAAPGDSYGYDEEPF